MKSIAKILLIILSINLVLFCSNGQGSKALIYAGEKMVTLQKFISYKGDVNKQAELINSLQRESRMRFLKEFLPNSSFYLGAPDEWFTFLKDGTAIVDLEPDVKSSTLKFVNWSMNNNELTIKSENIEFLGYNVLIADDYSFDVNTWNKGKKNESKHLIVKLKIKKINPEENDEYYEYRYVGHGPATDKIKEYYKKMGWKTEY